MKKISYIDNIIEWRNEFEFFKPVTVRFSETDMFGHMNNTVPFVYFEQARIEYLKSLHFMQEWIKPTNDTIPVVADLQCDFLQQVFFGDELNIFVKASKIGTSSVDLHYMSVNRKNEICFVGRGTIVQISKKTGTAIPWTEEMKEKMRGSYHRSPTIPL
ncbi:thioesterase family protein [Bacillus spongiae]|uniref:Thioesterase family protein n=1 Tax=Bacillus spongiae TaxID=2683610 RepID=A0ABU8H8I7_9BACI